MPIAFACPCCGKAYTLKDYFAGKKVTCVVCRQAIRVPKPDPEGPHIDKPSIWTAPQPTFDWREIPAVPVGGVEKIEEPRKQPLPPSPIRHPSSGKRPSSITRGIGIGFGIVFGLAAGFVAINLLCCGGCVGMGGLLNAVKDVRQAKEENARKAARAAYLDLGVSWTRQTTPRWVGVFPEGMEEMREAEKQIAGWIADGTLDSISLDPSRVEAARDAKGNRSQRKAMAEVLSLYFQAKGFSKAVELTWTPQPRAPGIKAALNEYGRYEEQF